MDMITVASVNCHQLGNVQKRTDIFDYLRQNSIFFVYFLIYFLHDIHFDPKLEKFVTAEWDFTSYFCLNNTRSRGVTILVNNKFEFKVKEIF